MDKGLAAPNRVWEHWTDEEVEALIDLHPAVVQVNIYEQQPATVREIQRHQLWELRNDLDCSFEYRMYGWHDMIECALQAKVCLGAFAYPSGKIIPFNEPNIPLEGWGGIDYIQAAEDFAVVYKMLGGDRQLITPAMSPSADGYFLGTDAMTQLVREGLYDYLGLHEYLDQIFTPIQIPVSITECNGKAPSQVFDYLARLYPTAQEAIWFSSRWVGAEDPNYHWDLISNEELSNSFKNWKGVVEMVAVNLWVDWVVQKTINGERDFLNREAFVAHLQAAHGVLGAPEGCGFPKLLTDDLIAALIGRLSTINEDVQRIRELMRDLL